MSDPVPTPERVERLHLRRGAWNAAGRWCAGLALPLVFAIALSIVAIDGREKGALFPIWTTFAGIALLVGIWARAARRQAELAAARALVDAGLYEQAVRRLKPLTGSGPAGLADEALYLTACAYDRQGAQAMARGWYERYLTTYAQRGCWSVEATVRLAALEADGPGGGEAARLDVTARRPEEAAAGERCPFCRAAIATEALTAECSSCGTPHHLGCYEEQGGCSVYGCKSRKVRGQVRQPDA